MSQITRPTKQGGATTYQGKVSAGYTTILASEMDDDLDKIYSAWNTGVDGSNIRPGVITGGMLAPGAVGTRELADGGVATIDLADAAVTTPKIADGNVTAAKLAAGAVGDGNISGVSWSKISGGAVQDATVPVLPRAALFAEAGGFDLQANTPGSPSYDNTKPSYLVRLDYTADSFVVFRAPPPGTAFVSILQVTGAGVTYATLPPGAIGRTQLAVNAIQGNLVGIGNPASFILSTPNVWTNFVTLPPLTTRGGMVQLVAAPSLSVSLNGGSGAVASRWWRGDGIAIKGNSWLVGTAVGTFVPVPPLNWIDQAPPAGTYTYSYQVMTPPGATMEASSTTDGGFIAYEIG